MKSTVKPNHYNDNTLEFELPIVHTEYSLQQVFKEELLNHTEEILDLGVKVPIYSFNIYSMDNLLPYEVITKTQRILTIIANAYKWINEDLLLEMLRDKAEEIRRISLGGGITDTNYFIEQAIVEKDTIIVNPNNSIRFIKNNFYRHEPKDDSHDLGYKNNAHFQYINKILGQEKKDINYRKIEESMADYDLNRKTMYKCIVSQNTGLSTKTVKRYLKEYPELNEMYLAIKNHSGTKEQQEIRKYYKTRKSAQL